MEITKDTRVPDILTEYGHIAEVMEAFGIKRVGRYSVRRIITKALTVENAARVHPRPREIAVVGEPESLEAQALLSVARDGYRLFQVVALGSPDRLQLAGRRQLPSNTADGIGSIAAVPLLQDRGLVNGQAAAYVCRDFACQAPVTRPEELWARLKQQ